MDPGGGTAAALPASAPRPEARDPRHLEVRSQAGRQEARAAHGDRPGRTAAPATAAETVRWRIMGDSLALALGGEWVNYRLKLKGKRLTLSGGDLTEPVTFERVGSADAAARYGAGPAGSGHRADLDACHPERVKGAMLEHVPFAALRVTMPQSSQRQPELHLPPRHHRNRPQRLVLIRHVQRRRRTPPAGAPAPPWRARRPPCCTAGSGAPAPRPPSPGWCTSASSSAAARLERWPADPAIRRCTTGG